MISQQRLVTLLQICGAALGIPAAAAGSYTAYKTFFSPEATCPASSIRSCWRPGSPRAGSSSR